jgi:hypothetical protein
MRSGRGSRPMRNCPHCGGSLGVKLEGPIDPPPAQDGVTSRAAARHVAMHVTGYRALVLGFIKAQAAAGRMGATDDEIIEWWIARGGKKNTPRARRIELEKMGLIEDSGWRRKTTSGRSAIVWRPVTSAPNSFATAGEEF